MKRALLLLPIFVIAVSMGYLYRTSNARVVLPPVTSTVSDNVRAEAEATNLAPSYPVHGPVIATMFWVGEGADASNAYIANHQSYWDETWLQRFGGVDDPTDRCGYAPCSFSPRENPFYVALPYGEYDAAGSRKTNTRVIPWFDASSSEPLLKNRWVEVVRNGRVCFAQWEDVGPFETDDVAYVFGTSPPKNSFGVRAGIDISPAVWDCLGLTTNAPVRWRFVDASAVSNGPWKEVVTVSDVTY